jgi:hypothetical protein
MTIDRNPVDRIAAFDGLVAVAHVMTAMNAIVKHLREATVSRFEEAEDPVQQRRIEISVVDEIVGDAVDVPGDAEGISDAHRGYEGNLERQRKMNVREDDVHRDDVEQMHDRERDGNSIPIGIAEKSRSFWQDELRHAAFLLGRHFINQLRLSRPSK